MRSHLRIPYDALDVCLTDLEQLYALGLWRRIDQSAVEGKQVRIQYRAEGEACGLTHGAVRRLVSAWCDAGLISKNQDGIWLIVRLTPDGACVKTGLEQGSSRVETGSSQEQPKQFPKPKQGRNRVQTGFEQPPLGDQPTQPNHPPPSEEEASDFGEPTQPTLVDVPPAPEAPSRLRMDWEEAAAVYSAHVRPRCLSEAGRPLSAYRLRWGHGDGAQLEALLRRYGRRDTLRLLAWWAYSPSASWIRGETDPRSGKRWKAASIGTLAAPKADYLARLDVPRLDLDNPGSWEARILGPPPDEEARPPPQDDRLSDADLTALMAMYTDTYGAERANQLMHDAGHGKWMEAR